MRLTISSLKAGVLRQWLGPPRTGGSHLACPPHGGTGRTDGMERRLVLSDRLEVLPRRDVLVADELREVRGHFPHPVLEVHHDRVLVGVSIRSRCMRKNGADPPCESGLRFCSTVNLTSSAVTRRGLRGTARRAELERPRSELVRGLPFRRQPGPILEGLGSRMMSGSYMQSHSVFFSDWLERQANGVSIPHCPTAMTSRRRLRWRARRRGAERPRAPRPWWRLPEKRPAIDRLGSCIASSGWSRQGW